MDYIRSRGIHNPAFSFFKKKIVKYDSTFNTNKNFLTKVLAVHYKSLSVNCLIIIIAKRHIKQDFFTLLFCMKMELGKNSEFA